MKASVKNMIFILPPSSFRLHPSAFILLHPRQSFIKVLAADSQYPRSLGLVPARSRKRFGYILGFHFSQRLRFLSPPLHQHGGPNRLREIRYLQPFAGRNDHCPLDRICQLTHVAGKFILL